jgi:hypothetical protein
VAAVAERSWLDEGLPAVSIMALILGVPFFVFAATEEQALSPRVRRDVPESAARATRLAFFLPGGGRGLLWCVMMALLLTSAPSAIASAFSIPVDDEPTRAVNALALYGVGYAALGTLVRRFFGPGPAGSWWSRLVVLGAIVAGTLISVLVTVLAGMNEWNPVHVVNPFFTVVAHASDDADAAILLLVLGDILLLLLTIGAMGGGLTEVAQASAARRERASGG